MADLTITFVNNTGAYRNGQIFVAIASDTSGKHYEPGRGFVANSDDVPSFPLAQLGPSLSLTIPDGITAGIIVTFIDQQLKLIGAVSPDPTNPRFVDVAYELVEFTTQGNASAIDTSQVDQFGFPLQLTYNGQSVGVGISRHMERQAYVAFMSTPPARAAAYGALKTPNRVLSPGKYLGVNPFITSPLHTAFDDAIRSLFLRKDLQFTINTAKDGTNGTYTGNPVIVKRPDRDNHVQEYNALQFTSGGLSFDIFLPFFSNSAVNRHPQKPLSPNWIQTIGDAKDAPSPGSMVLQNNGVFADWSGGVNGQDYTGKPGNTGKQAPAAIELQLVSALNRGVSGRPVAEWNANFYSDDNCNLYAKFLHTGTSNGTPVFIDGKAYGFAYDEINPSKFEGITLPAEVTITYGPWT